MGSHFAEVLRQGLWASLTGGWFYDPQMSLFCNTFHLYLWLILFLSPFVLKLTVPKTGVFIAWSLYSLFITVLFITIKTINFQLHKLFDTSEKYDDHTKSKADGNDRWTRLNSASQSIEHIEMEELGQSQSQLVLQSTQAGNDSTGSTSKILADIESRKTKAITSLEAITSMEDLASLPDIKEIEPKKEVSTETLPDQQTASDVEEFKQTIKAILAQATPQTSPLSHRRRALSQDRWSISLGSTPPPTLKRQAPQYLSQRVNRRRNAIYRRRSKSVADSPHGSHMLVGESRTEENPPLTIEWAGYPHPSPRPRHRIRQMSLEEPLHNIPGRRYSLELKPSQRGKGRGVVSHSSDTLVKDDRHVLKEGLIKEVTDNKKSSILTDSVSEITSSLESGRENEGTEWTTTDCEKSAKDVVPAPEQSSESSSLAQSNTIYIEGLMSDAPLSVITDSTPRSNTNNSAKEAEDPEKSTTQLDNLPIVEEIGEDRPRNPTPTTASYLGDSTGGAIPKTSHGKAKRPNQYSLNSRKSHGKSSAPLEIRAPATVLEGESSSPVSSSSGSENTALLVTTKSGFDGSVHHDMDAENSQKRSSSRRLTNEGSFRSSVRQGRYYGSQSSWGSRRSTHRPSVSEPISDKNPGSTSNDWHYFQDHTVHAQIINSQLPVVDPK